MARITKVLVLFATALVALLSVAQARYYGRTVVGRRGGIYHRSVVVAPYSRWGRPIVGRPIVVVGRHLLQDDAAAEAAPTETTEASEDCMTLSALLDSRKDEFSLLIKAIEKLPQEFKDELKENVFSYTFFAPTDDAIKRFTDWVGEEVEESEMVKNGTAALAILSYHIVPEVAAKSTDLTNGQMLVTALGEEFPLQVDTETDGVTLMGVGSQAKVVEADLPTCKGVVHVIDDVLLPVDGDGELDEEEQLKSAVKEEIDRLVAGGAEGAEGAEAAPAPESP